MSGDKENTAITELQKEQMLKLITRNFYRELINYGIDKKDIITASSHLLDYLLKDLKETTLRKDDEYYNKLFTINNIADEWSASRRFAIKDVSISSLKQEQYPKVAAWLSDTAIKYNFIPPFPESEDRFKDYFDGSNRYYFTIYHDQEPVGIIGAENIDHESGKLEMRKLVGNTNLRGKGIGKFATFLFLYYAFMTLNVEKVYIHSGDANIRNIILNSKFGFELEGIFFDDVLIQSKRKDVVRMGLLKPRWTEIFTSRK
ncbi:MAG TPA: GNAT family protein [Nitrospirota bacterium]